MIKTTCNEHEFNAQIRCGLNEFTNKMRNMSEKDFIFNDKI